jgi:hypothetical protein
MPPSQRRYHLIDIAHATFCVGVGQSPNEIKALRLLWRG